MQEMYTIPDVAKIVGVEYGTLRSWIAHGFICPSVNQIPGRKGVKRFCDTKNIYEVELFHSLMGQGISRSKCADIVKNVDWRECVSHFRLDLDVEKIKAKVNDKIKSLDQD